MYCLHTQMGTQLAARPWSTEHENLIFIFFFSFFEFTLLNAPQSTLCYYSSFMLI